MPMRVTSSPGVLLDSASLRAVNEVVLLRGSANRSFEHSFELGID
jgi:hypothetical protein